MKKRLLLQLLVLGGLILALGIMPALGNTLTMNQDHTLSTVYSANLVSLGYLTTTSDPTIPVTYAYAYGASDTNGVPQGPDFQYSYTPTLLASVSGTYYPTTTAQVENLPTAPSTVNFGLNQGMVAVAPPPLGNTFQETFNSLTLVFQVVNDGAATLTITDGLSNMIYGATGDFPAFLNTNANTNFTAEWFSTNVYGDYVAQSLLADYRDYPDTVNFSGSIASITQVDASLTGLTAGEYVYLILTLDSTLQTQSGVVPVPPTVWLFGSGLVGFWGLRRRLSLS